MYFCGDAFQKSTCSLRAFVNAFSRREVRL